MDVLRNHAAFADNMQWGRGENRADQVSSSAVALIGWSAA